jgi:hypothetical protein
MSGLDLSELVAGLHAAQQAVDQAADEGLLAAARQVLSAAEQVVPIESHGLESSGRAAIVGEHKAAVGFGSGDSAPYAIIQHENLSLQHDAGRTGHFLSGPLIANADNVGKTIAAHIKQVL